MIDAFSFGQMIINGKTYRKDLIIYPDRRIDPAWRRQNGHRLIYADIAALIQRGPQTIVVGTGASGMMVPDTHLHDTLTEMNIAFEAAPTKEAVNIFNRLIKTKRVGACFHLTC